MAMTRYGTLDELQREINRLFESDMDHRSSGEGGSASNWVPAVDIREEEGAFVIHADIPGVEPKDIDVSMDNGVLTIKGERRSETREEQEQFRKIERLRGTFLRRFTLPDTVDPEKISAKSVHGVLEVRVPKGERSQSRRITVTS